MRKKGSAAAIILAAGSGLRFGAENGRKQFVLVAGVPVVIRSVKAFEVCRLIDEIIVVAPEEDREMYQALFREYRIQKVKCIVPGGKTRQESARLGSDAVSSSIKYMAIHDAARCLVTPEMIEFVFAAAYQTGAAIAAQPARDTVKISDKRGFITETVDRKTAWYAQTPQVFRSNLYRAAAYVSASDGIEATDDASLVEHIGQPVALVDCGSRNIKVTYPEDAAIAEAICMWEEKQNADRARI